MMKIRIFSVLLILSLTACSPAATQTVPSSSAIIQTPTPLSTLTPLPTATPLPIATPLPQAVLIQPATLLSGPDDRGFTALAELSSGTSVGVMGTFVDYAQIQVSVNGTLQTGFIPRLDLDTIPSGISELTKDRVPWLDLSLQNRLVLAGFTQVSSSTAVTLTGISNGTSDFVLHMHPDDSFRITLQMNTNTNDIVSIQLGDKMFGKPEWWSDLRQINLNIEEGHWAIWIRDGLSDDFQAIPLDVDSSETVTALFPDPHGTTILFTRADGSLIQSLDIAHLTGTNLPDGLFPDGDIYMSYNVPPQATITIHTGMLEVAPSGKWSGSTVMHVPSLKDAFVAKDISMATVFNYTESRDPHNWDALFANYDTLTVGDFYWGYAWEGRGQYNFSRIDKTVDWARANHFRVRGSLVWGALDSGVPNWIIKGHFSRDELIDILREHVTTVINHLKGRVDEWVVVNEYFSRLPYADADYWRTHIGPDYVNIAFQAARDADPNAILILNDTNNESPRDSLTRSVSTAMLDGVRKMKEQGVPIDAVGMEMHLLNSPWSSKVRPEKEDVVKTMQEFGALGVKVYITEFDVDLHVISGTQDERLEYQAQLYRDMLEACLVSGVCAGFSTWGVADAVSWISHCGNSSFCLNHPDGAPLMLDDDYHPKPAFFAVYDVLTKSSRP